MHTPTTLSLLRCMISLSALSAAGDAYRPVIMMHGILSSALDLEILRERISSSHPGTDILNVDLYENLDSIKPMWDQVAGVMKKVIPFMANATDGVNMVCYSQGKHLATLRFGHHTRLQVHECFARVIKQIVCLFLSIFLPAALITVVEYRSHDHSLTLQSWLAIHSIQQMTL